MRYYFTDFYPWEKEIMYKAYEEAGLFLYSLIDTGGLSFLISYGFCNRFGYIIIDQKIPNDSLTDKEFYAMNPVEDETLDIKGNYAKEIAAAKEEYDSKAEERKAAWNRLLEEQDIKMELERKYPLFGFSRKTPIYGDCMLILQGISVYSLPETKMRITYYLRSFSKDKAITVSKDVVVDRGCHTKTWLRAIEKAEGLTGRKYIKGKW